MQLYRFYNRNNNHIISKFYTLGGMKSLLNNRHNYLNKTHESANREVIEYEVKEIRRLSIEELKEINNKNYKDNLVKLIKLAVSTKSTILFNTENTGELIVDKSSVKFNSLEEAIKIINSWF